MAKAGPFPPRSLSLSPGYRRCCLLVGDPDGELDVMDARHVELALVSHSHSLSQVPSCPEMMNSMTTPDVRECAGAPNKSRTIERSPEGLVFFTIPAVELLSQYRNKKTFCVSFTCICTLKHLSLHTDISVANPL